MVQGFQVRVLVVDNDPFTLTLVTEALAAANFAVNGVPTVPDAISTIESFSPNVLVTDLNFGHGDYPILIRPSPHTWGAMGLAVTTLIFGLIANGNFRLSFFFREQKKNFQVYQKKFYLK